MLGVTWNMVPIILDVHFVQASLCWRVLYCDRAVLVVSDVGTGCSTRWHTHFTCGTDTEHFLSSPWKHRGVRAYDGETLTCDLSFLHGEGNDQTKGPQHRLHPVHRADGIIGGLEQRGGTLVSTDWELWDIIQREEEMEAQQHSRAAESKLV